MKDIIIIPTYNEKDNIEWIINTVNTLYPDIEIWVVDDNSPDGTALVVSKILVINPKIKLINRQSKTGLGDAYKETLLRIKELDNIRYIVTMDADGSHDPSKIAELISALSEYDFSIGSRYTSGGGKMAGMGLFRNFLSIGGNIYSRIIIGFSIIDSTAGFVAFKKQVLHSIDISNISSSGYSYQIEFKHSLIEAGNSFVEIPITFIDRKHGKSKMSMKIIMEGVLAPWKIAWKKTFKKDYFNKVLKKSLLSFLVIFTLFFSLYRITESPPVWYDEGIYIQNAQNLVHSGIMGVQLSPDNILHFSKFTVGYPLIYPLALIFKLFGTGVLQARLLMTLFILGLCVTVYLFVKKLHSKNIAIASLALLATFPPLYGNGKSVLGEVPGLFFILLSFYFISKFFNNRSKKYIIFGGLMAGLAIATKPFYLLFIPALILGLFIKWKGLSLKRSDLLLGITATIIPLIIWFFSQFKFGDSFTEIFSFYANPYHSSNIVLLMLSNIKGLFVSMGPLYLIIITSIWILSVIIRYIKKVSISLEEYIALFFNILCILAYLRTPGLFRYIFPPQVISLIFFPYSLVSITKLFNKNIFAYFLISLLSVFGVYQICFDSWVADAYSSNKTSVWQNYFENTPSSKSVFFYNVPEVGIFKKNNNYYQYIEPAPNIIIGSEQLDLIKKGSVDEIIIQTRALENPKDKLFNKYKITKTLYKYTILDISK